MTSIFEFYL